MMLEVSFFWVFFFFPWLKNLNWKFLYLVIEILGYPFLVLVGIGVVCARNVELCF